MSPAHAAPYGGKPVTTMSSREIAELTGKEHFNVRRDIQNMLRELGEDAFKFEGMSKDAYGRPLPVFNLPKDLTITLVSGYNVTMRHRIVTRWMELEEQQVKPTSVAVSNDPLDLLLAQAQMFPKLITEMQEQKRAQAVQAAKVERLKAENEPSNTLNPSPGAAFGQFQPVKHHL